MKINILLSLILYLAFGCKQANKYISENHSQPKKPDKEYKIPFPSAKIEKLLKEQRVQHKFSVNYDSFKSDSGWTKVYEINNLRLFFKSTYYNAFNHRDVLHENIKLNKTSYGNIAGTSIDSMDMNIDYQSSRFYTFRNDSSYILTVSIPMNWAGTMTKFSFFQLINLADRNVIEFIREEE